MNAEEVADVVRQQHGRPLQSLHQETSLTKRLVGIEQGELPLLPSFAPPGAAALALRSYWVTAPQPGAGIPRSASDPNRGHSCHR